MVKTYSINKKCCICDRDNWTDSNKIFTKIFILAGSLGTNFIYIKKNYDQILVGINYKNKDICIPCVLLLSGFEEYYDKFFIDLLENIEVKNIINFIRKDKKLLHKISIIRSDGKFIPSDIINKIKINSQCQNLSNSSH